VFWAIKNCFLQQIRCLQTARTHCLLASGHEPACPGAEWFLSGELTDAQNLVVMDKSCGAGRFPPTPHSGDKPQGVRSSVAEAGHM